MEESPDKSAGKNIFFKYVKEHLEERINVPFGNMIKYTNSD